MKTFILSRAPQPALFVVLTGSFLGLFTVLLSGVSFGAGAKSARHVGFADKCSTCAAKEVWSGFVEHMKAKGRADLIPEEWLKAVEEKKDKKDDAKNDEPKNGDLKNGDLKNGAAEDEKDLKPSFDPEAGDPIRGVLFKISPDLINLDSLFEFAEGKPLDPASAEKARALVEKLRAAKDPYLEAYAEFYGARLDVEAKSYEAARKPLEGLVESKHFLPRREARRYLAQAYRGLPDETLAVLELQFFLLDLPEENESDVVWAEEELKAIREKKAQKDDGPLHDSEKSMRSISTLISGLDVGNPTQGKQLRVEDILDKVAKLLERKGGT
jgi:hypothetical protein